MRPCLYSMALHCIVLPLPFAAVSCMPRSALPCSSVTAVVLLGYRVHPGRVHVRTRSLGAYRYFPGTAVRGTRREIFAARLLVSRTIVSIALHGIPYEIVLPTLNHTQQVLGALNVVMSVVVRTHRSFAVQHACLRLPAVPCLARPLAMPCRALATFCTALCVESWIG